MSFPYSRTYDDQEASSGQIVEDEEDDSIDYNNDGVSELEGYCPLLNEAEYNDPFLDDFGRPITLTPPPIAMPPHDASYSEEFLNMVRQCVNKAQSSILPTSHTDTPHTDNINGQQQQQQQQQREYTDDIELLTDFIDSLNQGITTANSIKNSYTTANNIRPSRKDKGKQKVVEQQQQQQQQWQDSQRISPSFGSLIDYEAYDTPKGVLSHRIRLQQSPAVASRLPSLQQQFPSCSSKKKNHKQEAAAPINSSGGRAYHAELPYYNEQLPPSEEEDMLTIERGRRELNLPEQPVDPLLLRENDEFFVLDKVPANVLDLHYVSTEKFKKEQQVKDKEKKLMDAIDNDFYHQQEKERRLNKLAVAQQQAQQRFVEEHPERVTPKTDNGNTEEEEQPFLNESKDFSSWLCFDNDDEYARFKNFIERKYGNESSIPEPTISAQEQRTLVDEMVETKRSARPADNGYNNKKTTVFAKSSVSSLTPLSPGLGPTTNTTNTAVDERQIHERNQRLDDDIVEGHQEEQEAEDASSVSFTGKILRSSTPKKKSGVRMTFSKNAANRSYSFKQERKDITPPQQQQPQPFKGLFEDDEGSSDSYVSDEENTFGRNRSKCLPPNTSTATATSKRFLTRSSATIGRDQTTRRPLFSLSK